MKEQKNFSASGNEQGIGVTREFRKCCGRRKNRGLQISRRFLLVPSFIIARSPSCRTAAGFCKNSLKRLALSSRFSRYFATLLRLRLLRLAFLIASLQLSILKMLSNLILDLFIVPLPCLFFLFHFTGSSAWLYRAEKEP